MMGGNAVWHALKAYRDWHAGKGDGVDVANASTTISTESRHEEQRKQLTFFEYVKRYVSDLILRYPELVSVKVFIGRMFMITDIASDFLLVTSLFANRASESNDNDSLDFP